MRPRREDAETQGACLNRRRLLQVGGLGSLGLNLAGLLRAEAARDAAATASVRGRAQPIKSCILIFYYGGPSHHDSRSSTCDPMSTSTPPPDTARSKYVGLRTGH